MSILPVLAGTPKGPVREATIHHSYTGMFAIRKGKWKLIHNLVNDSTWLYDLEKDIGETTDLSLAQKEIADELYQLLEKWRRDCNAEFPVPNPGFLPEGRYEWGKHPDQN